MPLVLPRRTLTPMLQPDNTDLCGQTCIAMVAGCTLDEAVFACQCFEKDGVLERDMRAGLERLGVKTGRPVQYRWRKSKGKQRGYQYRKSYFPDFCLASMTDRTQWAHVVVFLDGLVYDPAIGWPMPLHIYEHWVIEGRYSRLYSTAVSRRWRRNSQRARWDTFIPILSEPPCPSSSPSPAAPSPSSTALPASSPSTSTAPTDATA